MSTIENQLPFNFQSQIIADILNLRKDVLSYTDKILSILSSVQPGTSEIWSKSAGASYDILGKPLSLRVQNTMGKMGSFAESEGLRWDDDQIANGLDQEPTPIFSEYAKLANGSNRRLSPSNRSLLSNRFNIASVTSRKTEKRSSRSANRSAVKIPSICIEVSTEKRTVNVKSSSLLTNLSQMNISEDSLNVNDGSAGDSSGIGEVGIAPVQPTSAQFSHDESPDQKCEVNQESKDFQEKDESPSSSADTALDKTCDEKICYRKVSFSTLIFLIPAFDGRGRSLSVYHFNQTDFENVHFFKNGLHPKSYFANTWDFTFSMSFLAFVWIAPFSIAFCEDFQFLDVSLFAYMFCALNAADTVVAVLTPRPKLTTQLCSLVEYEVRRPVLKDWIQRWLRCYLILDLVTIVRRFTLSATVLTKARHQIPFETVVPSGSGQTPVLIIAQCLRFYRLPGMLATCPIFQRASSTINSAAGFPATHILNIVFAIFYFLHLNACCIYYFGRISGFDGWVFVWPEAQEASLGQFYSWTFFQAVGNMFPINFTPQTALEQAVAAMFIVCAAILYGTFLGSISSAAVSINPSGRLYNQKLDELNDYVKWKNLDPMTEQKLVSYYEVKYRGKYFEEQNLLADMNDSLRAEIAIHNTRWLVEKVPFLRRNENDGRDAIFFSRIASMLNANYFIRGDFITKQGEAAMDMYFIHSGRCDVLIGDRLIKSLYDGAYFGEIALIAKVLRTASIQAATHAMLYRLTYQDFHTVLSEFVDMKERIDALARERELLTQK
ncbi:Potassium voltage-gated channel sub H member 7 [Entophlyctis luteolus]|nr:Potassium voltage-gated channel sub H member 7 [Entophlyctis luteolus]